MALIHFKNKMKQKLYSPGKNVSFITRGLTAVSELGKSITNDDDDKDKEKKEEKE